MAAVRYGRLTYLVLLTACAGSPTVPTPLRDTARTAAAAIFLQGEPGSGDGMVFQRSAAVGGGTLHLAPSERRTWSFTIDSGESLYAVGVTYSNSRGGDLETLSVELDGRGISSFQVADTGEEADGWNTFTTHSATTVRVSAGSHTLVIQSTGGDGCVEIDFVSLSRM